MEAESSKMGASRVDLEVDELLSKLQLSEEERDGVVLAKVDRENLPAVKWMAVAKLLTSKDFSVTSLMSTMRAAWNPAREVSFRSIGKNLFVIQAFCLGDWKRIMEEGPWIFRGYALMMEEFDGSTTIPKETPNRVRTWIQIHKIPHLYRTEEIVKQLAAKVGEVQEVVIRAVPSRTGDFHRVRVKLLADKPLIRVVTLAPEGQEKILLQVKYEKLPRFCAHCGLMGHVHLECGAGEYGEKDLHYGAWMIADTDTWCPGTLRFRSSLSRDSEVPRDGGGRGSGERARVMERGRGRNRGGWTRAPREGVWKEKTKETNSSESRKRTSRDGEGDELDHDKELDDTASSPMKIGQKAGKEEAGREEFIAKKQLILEVSSKDAMDLEVPPPPPMYVPPRDKKRMKKIEAQGKDSNASKTRAGSEEEHRHSQ